jgi:hypothetical protein
MLYFSSWISLKRHGNKKDEPFVGGRATIGL